jgi:hypothetical protein
LYQFGYETPDQRLTNDELGWDHEDSFAFHVVAADSERALRWAREVTEALVHSLYASRDWEGEIPSWKEDGYAHWIEVSSDQFPHDVLNALSEIADGEMPTPADWLAKKYAS